MSHGAHTDHSNHTGHSPTPQNGTEEGLRDPHAWNNGYGFGPLPRLHLGDQHAMGGVLFDRFEAVREDQKNSATYDLKAFYGYIYDRILIKAEGHAAHGRLEESKTELFWSHAITPFWNRNIGMRHDNGEEPARNWFAIGIDGLAPYWFEIDATAYLGSEGRLAAKLEAEYELLLTQRLILQPRFEANLYNKRDEERLQGSGVSDAAVGLRLRYEIRREFAPYIGIEWSGKLGNTADMVRSAGDEINEQQLVAGVRFWF